MKIGSSHIPNLDFIGTVFEGLVWGLALMVFFMVKPVYEPKGSKDAVDKRSQAASSQEQRSKGPAGFAGLKEVERLVLELTNKERSKQGLPPLALDKSLEAIALKHTQDMLARKYFSHDNPDNLSSAERMAKSHRQLVGVEGENIWLFAGPAPPDPEIAKRMVGEWMNSIAHRGNILRPGFTHTGLGVAELNNVIKATQVFAEVAAWINTPVPEKLKRGTRLDLTAKPTALTKVAPGQCQLLAVQTGEVAGPFPVNEVKADVPPGRYQIRFLFGQPQGPSTKYTVYPGPEIEVQ